jgi:hypothetical protein
MERLVANLDVRLHARTTSGHFIYWHYHAQLPITENVGKVIQGAPDATSTEYGEIAFFPTPTMETSDPELKWIERSTFIGEGRVVVDKDGAAVEYEVYRVVNAANAALK